MFIPKPEHKELITEIIHQWEKDTDMTMELETASKVYQKDVNNYILLFTTGKIKCKGGMVAQYKNTKQKSIRKSLAVIDDCVVEYLLYNTPIMTTLMKTLKEDPTRFQQIIKAGGSYDKCVWWRDGKYIDIGKINRVYATTDKSCGGLHKLKLHAINKQGEEYVQYNKFANTSEHCYIDNDLTFNFNKLDINYYYNLAVDRINKYLGKE